MSTKRKKPAIEAGLILLGYAIMMAVGMFVQNSEHSPDTLMAHFYIPDQLEPLIIVLRLPEFIIVAPD